MSTFAERLSQLDSRRLQLLALELQARVGALEARESEPVAIVGMGCRFPGGANDPAQFWDLLASGTDAISEVPPDRWDPSAFFDANPDVPGKTSTRWGGFLKDVDVAGFDAPFFGISPREAVRMSPQQRLLLEVGWEAFESAGVPQERLAGSKTGVFVGVSGDDYVSATGVLDDLRNLDAYAGTGIAPNVTAGRLSYVLGLNGPNLAVDTACSSSLVAVHLACQSLRDGECDLALAGGVSLMLAPVKAVYLAKLRALAADGRCKTFDARADGIVQGEGCGVVILRRLSDARAAGDRILALIRGSAVNHDGRSSGLTVPSGPAQQAVIRAAVARAGVDPAKIDFVEAHGTGTRLGDPIEVAALSAALGPSRGQNRPLRLGSVKGNLGHLDAAAGIAGLIKVVLMLNHRMIPGQLHLEEVNPAIDLEAGPITIPTRLTPWSANGETRLAGVSAFSLSGTNAHLVVEESLDRPSHPGERAAAPSATGRPEILPITARDPAALDSLARAYLRLLRAGDDAAEPALGDIAFTASVRRSQHRHRLAVVGRTKAEVAERLEAWLGGARPSIIADGDRGERPVPSRLVFVFSGQGSQWVGMGRQLIEREGVFREAVEACGRALAPFTNWSLLDVLRSDDGWWLDRIDVIQPALFGFQLGLTALWRSWGVEPDAVIGHSLGEVAAAHAAGALSLDSAARVICERSRLSRRLSGQGGMAVVGLPRREAALALAGYEDRLSIGGLNGPRSTVVTGDLPSLGALLDALDRQGIFNRRIKIDVASHGRQFDALAPDFLEALTNLSPSPATVPMYSTVTGTVLDGRAFTPAYWVDNLRQPVLFDPAIERALGDGYNVFLELSPHPALGPSLVDRLREAKSTGAVIAGPRRDRDTQTSLIEALGAIFVSGYPIDSRRLYPRGGSLVDLPSYPWQRERFWATEGNQDGATRGLDRRVTRQSIEAPAEPTGTSRVIRRDVLLADGPSGRRRELAAYLAQHVSEVLRLPLASLDPRRPLIDLGLDSLTSLELRQRVEADLGISLPPATFIAGATSDVVDQVLEIWTEQHADAQRHQHSADVVSIRPTSSGASRPPLFCCAPALGLTFPFVALARQLGDDQPLYGLQPPGADRRERPISSVDELAERYRRALQAIQPTGPYFVFGWSFGGLVAYELARQLAADGEQIGLVAIVDTPAPATRGAILPFVRYLLAIGGPGALPFLSDYLRYRGVTERPIAENPRANGFGPRIGRLWRFPSFKMAIEQALLVAAVPEAARPALAPAIGPLVRVSLGSLRAALRYPPRSYAGRVTLLRTDNRPDGHRSHGDDDPTWDWGALARNGVDVQRVPGDHMSVMREPNVRELAVRLRACLDRAVEAAAKKPPRP